MEQLDGIREKLKRAEENIVNLNREIDAFLDQGERRVIPDDDDELIKQFIEYWSQQEVPLRFSVLAGEIVHHFRSCLDHLIWQLVKINGGNPDANKTEFPIFDRAPVNKEETTRFRRKIKGVSSRVETMIEGLQPYKRGVNRFVDPLFIIHELDRIDKHRELMIVISDPKRNATWALFGLGGPTITFQKTKDPAQEISLSTSRGHEVKVEGNLTAEISFAQFGQRENQPIIPSLAQLLNRVREIVALFESQFK